MKPENIVKFLKSVGLELVPPDHPIYQDKSWRDLVCHQATIRSARPHSCRSGSR